MVVDSIPWVIEEQTVIKYELLRHYIDPWMSILFSTQKKYNKPEKLIYFDGFAGPGIYYIDQNRKDTCNGSPLIVAEIANKYIDKNINREIIIHCIDNNKNCVNLLREKLSVLNKYKQNWEVHYADFDDKIHEVLNKLEKEYLIEQPMFFFIDPFGYSGYSLETMKRILQYPIAELFINFMVYDIIRFKEAGYTEQYMKDLFGTDEYKQMETTNTPYKRQVFLKNLYCRQLELAGAKFVIPFRVNTPEQGTRPRYYLIHASKNLKALKVMKDNMAKLSEKPYNFEAIGIITKQMSLFEDPDKISLKEKLLNFFKDIYPNPIDYKDIEDWAYKNTNGINKTIKETLIDLESENKIDIQRKKRQRKNTVSEGALIKFIKK